LAAVITLVCQYVLTELYALLLIFAMSEQSQNVVRLIIGLEETGWDSALFVPNLIGILRFQIVQILMLFFSF